MSGYLHGSIPFDYYTHLHGIYEAVNSFYSRKLKMPRFNKLGVATQLECWNDGIMENWALGYWIVGLLGRRRQNDKN
jgi:hypothetical protein